MLKIITVSSPDHIKFIDSCKYKVKNAADYANIDYEHLIKIDYLKEGQSVFRNILLKQINDNDIICFMDADDYPSHFLFKNIKYLQTYDIIYGNYKFIESQEIIKSNIFNKELFLKKNFIPFSGSLVRGNVAKQAIFNNIKHGNDWHYWHQLVVKGFKFKYINEIFSHRRELTSYKRSNIPVYRKLRRLYRNYKVKQMIKQLWNG